MKIIFLGTSGSMPTSRRGPSSVAIIRKGELLLFDCGEGTQQKMVVAHLGFNRPTRIFISHLHGDHILGLPGLIQTMSLLRREHSLNLYGPRGLHDFLKAVSSTLGGPGFPLKINEIVNDGTISMGSEYRIEVVRADHEAESWSYALIEQPRPGKFHPELAKSLGVPEGPLWRRLQHGETVTLGDGREIRSEDVVDPPRRGLKITYSGDTRPSKKLVELAMDSDVLIHEATFDDSLMERAAEDGHSTAGQAAEIAAAAKVKLLVLTHVSSRYPDGNILMDQAIKIFPNTRVAEDLMEIEVAH